MLIVNLFVSADKCLTVNPSYFPRAPAPPRVDLVTLIHRPPLQLAQPE